MFGLNTTADEPNNDQHVEMNHEREASTRASCELSVPLAFRSLSCNPSATFFFFITSPSHLSSCRLSSQQHAVQSLSLPLSLSLSLSGGCMLCVCAWDGRQAWPIYQTLLSPPPSSSCSFAPSLSNHRWLAVHLYASLSLRCVWYVRWLHSSVRLIFPLVLFFPTEWWGGVGGGRGGGGPFFVAICIREAVSRDATHTNTLDPCYPHSDARWVRPLKIERQTETSVDNKDTNIPGDRQETERWTSGCLHDVCIQVAHTGREKAAARYK